MRYKDKDNHLIQIKKIVKETIHAMPIGTEFYGWELRDMCIAGHPELEKAYVESFVKSMRMNCRELYICISAFNSRYKRIQPCAEKNQH